MTPPVFSPSEFDIDEITGIVSMEVLPLPVPGRVGGGGGAGTTGGGGGGGGGVGGGGGGGVHVAPLVNLLASNVKLIVFPLLWPLARISS